MRPTLALLTLATLIATPAAAQTRVTGPAPTMQVTDVGPAKNLEITALDVEARIVGHLAETSMTMTFFNPFGRALAGDLTFPLPAGSTVSGYGLDVDGALVDGVVVEKEKARRVFEIEVRKGVDPGLVEKVGGAAYRTRVFPIPARGTRTVKVSWISEVDDGPTGASYRLPLAFSEPIRDVHLRVEVVRPGVAPKVVGDGIDGFGFEAWEDRQVAETTVKDVVLDRAVTVALPGLAERPVAVERGPDGTVYFAIHDRVDAPANIGRIAPRRVALLWDASLSRDGRHDREIALLQGWIDGLGPRRVEVDLTVFADAPLPTRSFVLPRDAGALVETLRRTPYDGGTRMASLSALASGPAPDHHLFFSDGISNLGEADLPTFESPVYAVSDADVANHDALRAIAVGSGGAWIDLTTKSEEEALDALGRSPFSFRGATSKGGLGESYPRRAEPVDGPFSLAGRLTGPTSSVAVRFAGAGAAAEERVYVVDGTQAPEGTLLQRFWAQKKVAELAIGGRRNEPAMAAVGKRFGIVTPGTSLLVLERLDQYVEHEVRPPASLAAFRRDYDRAMADRAAAKKVEDATKLERIVALWEARVAYWDREFDWRYEAKESKQEGLGASGSGYGTGGRVATGAAEAPMSAMDAAPAMEPEADGYRDDDDEERAAGPRARRSPAKASPSGTWAEEGRPADRPAPSITLKPWDPATPYVAALKAAAPEDRFAVYLAERAVWGTAPAFFLDCADFFAPFDRAVALRILSNIVELDLEDPALLRVYAHRLVQVEELDLAILTFERIRELRAEEPQSHRDLALALAARADERALRPTNRAVALSDYQRAMDLLADVVMDEWDRFAEIELIALVELNDVLPKARELGDVRVPVDARLIQQLDMDVRIVMSWDADLTDMDLHVLEPSGEEAYYGHHETAIGGRVSRDFTQGYGPEEYSIRRAMPGTYELKTKFFGSSAATLQGAVTLYVDLYTDYGRPTQKKQSITLRLAEQKDTFTVGEITIQEDTLRVGM